MSIILSGLIHLFRPLLASLSGALDCEGLVPWYFLLGLRIVAIFFANGPWDTIREDVACNYLEPLHDRSREFCTALCHNQHFPISIAATWGLVFMALLLLVGLMRLTSPRRRKKRKREKEDKDKGEGLAIVATATHGGSPDISTIYDVGRHNLPMRYGNSRYHYDHPRNHHRDHHRDRHLHHPRHPHYAHWEDWHGAHGAPMAKEHGSDMSYGTCEARGYGMSVHPGHISQTKMPEHCYDMGQPKMSVGPRETRQTEMATHHDHTRQTTVVPYCGETEPSNLPAVCAPLPISSSPYKGNMAPKCWPCDECNEPLQRRHMDPQESGESTDYGYAKRHFGQGKMVPRYCEDGKYSMATKCKPVTEGNTGHIAAHPWADDKANMAIKRRLVQGTKMHNKHHVTFDATSRSDMGFGSSVCPQPWTSEESNCRPISGAKMVSGPSMAAGPMLCCHGNAACTCTEADPYHMTPCCEPQCEPSCCAETTHHDGHRESSAGPKERGRFSITKICGVPLFDVWVALTLAMEICYLCSIILIQLPKLWGRSWMCSSEAASCPQPIECAVKGRAEKRVALWGLAFTSILFIIACSGYFHLRMCWNKRCRRMCSEKEEEKHEEVCAEETEHEGRVLRGDVESCNEENAGV
ncbi:uncharacterized protein LOC133366186 isoform X2 [Rhineura floridana]|nr:uncharacterized protein LOC133366186 isoform X2 [Rhineura floridana]